MISTLQNLFDKIENQKHEVFELISGLTPEQLNGNPSSGKWSIAQIMSHLISAEQLSVSYIQKKIQGVEKADNSGIVEELKMILLKASQRIEGLKFKAPKHVVDNTMVYSELAELTRQWMKTRADFRELLEQVHDQHLRKKIYKHAVVGYLNIQHAVMFFHEHVTHHLPQIRKIVNSLK